jgi:hypothetical protein
MLYIRSGYVFRLPIYAVRHLNRMESFFIKHGRIQRMDHRKRYCFSFPFDFCSLILGTPTSSAATISIRYATVRRQGEEEANGLERRVITYPSTYYRLLPILSHAYVFILLGKEIVGLYSLNTNY